MELTKQVESEYVDEILEGLQKYWNYRANSYSKSNIEELNNFKRDAWLKILLENAVPSIWFHLLMAGYAAVAIILGFVIYKKKNHEFLYYV